MPGKLSNQDSLETTEKSGLQAALRFFRGASQSAKLDHLDNLYLFDLLNCFRTEVGYLLSYSFLSSSAVSRPFMLAAGSGCIRSDVEMVDPALDASDGQQGP